MRKRCSVCGDTCQTNVKFVWERASDEKRFDICGLCAESGRVNAESVNNYPSTYTDDRISPVELTSYERYKLSGGSLPHPSEVAKLRRFACNL